MATDGGVFDCDLKQDPARWQHLKVPAPVSETIARPARHLMSLACDALGLRDTARVDFRLDPTKALHLLEINGLPGLPRDGATHQATVLAGLDRQDGMAAAIITSALNRSTALARPPAAGSGDGGRVVIGVCLKAGSELPFRAGGVELNPQLVLHDEAVRELLEGTGAPYQRAGGGIPELIRPLPGRPGLG